MSEQSEAATDVLVGDAHSLSPVVENAPEASSVKDFITLLKPGVMLLVVFTGFAGLMLAPGQLHPFLQAIAVLCIAIGSGAGGAINMWFDRDIDAVMLRTVNRPIPAGRISADDGLVFGLLLALASVSLMGIAVNWLSAAILAGAIAFYVIIYTVWLKRRTPQNIVIGGAAGAFPPVIGWAAMSGDAFAPEAWLMFLIVFLWTPPHFWALALYRNGDYRRANVPMLPVVAGLEATKKQMLVYTLILLPVTLAPWFIGMSTWLYGITALLLSGEFIRHAWKVLKSDDDKPARAMFGYSILYLFAIFLALIVDKFIDNLGVLTLL
ncbi:MAG: protoheme IX farnesyltransferase [Alphaproteobacteria bacterium]|nr:protoheme IX farnesyltransferase [Alphaproteobacteria bacterium]